MDQLWYYAREGQSLGPVPFDELKRLAAGGQLAPTDSVCPVGSQQWQAASSVADLFPIPIPPPPLPIDPIPVLQLDESVAEKPPEDDRRRDRDRDRDRDDWRERDERRKPGPADEVIAVVTRFFSPDLHALKPTADEERDLKRAKIESPVIRNYAIWRRSVLFVVIVPGFLAALFSLISSFSTEGLSGFGILLAFLNAVATFALPVTALIAAMNYARLRMSSRVLLLGALIAYAMPIVSAIFPMNWLIDEKAASKGGAVSLILKISISLSFAVLAVLAGLTRASVRTKGLMPTVIVPGWMAIFSAPLLVLAGVATFLFLAMQYGNLLLILGILIWVAAPMIYLRQPGLLIRPVTRTKELKALSQSRLFVLIAASVGAFLIVLFLLVAKFEGTSATIVGFSKSDSMIRAWDPALHAVWLDYVSRALFLTVLFADLLLIMNLSIWKEQKSFAQSEWQAETEKNLEELDTLLAKPPTRRYDDDESVYGRREDRGRDDERRD